MINARQYLISFLATISGHKAVVGGLQRMEKSQDSLGKETVKGTKRGQSFNDMLMKASKRAFRLTSRFSLSFSTSSSKG